MLGGVPSDGVSTQTSPVVKMFSGCKLGTNDMLGGLHHPLQGFIFLLLDTVELPYHSVMQLVRMLSVVQR